MTVPQDRGGREGDRLSPELLDRVTRTCGFLRAWVWERRTDSTQRLARDRAARDGPGVLAIADEQTRGRGRLDRIWFSPAGAGLWMSLAFAPHRPSEVWPLLTSLAALALRDALSAASGIRCGLKWPNDVYGRGRKIAGVLAEVGPPELVTLGIGLNVSQGESDFAPDLRGTATSVRIESGRNVGRGKLLRRFLSALGEWLARFEAGEDESIRVALREASLLIGRQLVVAREASDEQVCGEAVDIGPLGELIVEAGSPPRPVRLMSGNVLRVEPPLEVGS